MDTGDKNRQERADENLRRTIRLTREMLALADEGDRDRLDASCGVIYGLMRDMAYRLRKTAEAECARHLEAAADAEPTSGSAGAGD
jgi:hypothetical protein